MNNFHLHIVIVGFAAGVPKRKVCIKESWYAAMTNYVMRRAYNKRWKAIGFKVPRNQTHGLVAYWS